MIVVVIRGGVCIVEITEQLVVVVADGDCFVGEEGVFAIVAHGSSESLHDGLCLEEQVPHYGVAVPPS